MTESTLNIPNTTLDALVELADRANGAEGKVRTLTLPNDPDNRYLIINPDGTYTTETPRAKARSVRLNSIDQMAPFVNHAIEKWGADPAVYYNKNGAIAVLDESDLLTSTNGSASVSFTESPQLRQLREFDSDHGSAWRSHKAFILLLRVTLEDCINPDQLEFLLKALAEVQLNNSEKATSSIIRGRESLGSEVISQLTSLADVNIPEQIVLMVRMFTDPALVARRQIVCKLETDPQLGKLAILPIANEIENAMDLEMSELGEMLRSSINSRPKALVDAKATPKEAPPERIIVPVFYGTP